MKLNLAKIGMLYIGTIALAYAIIVDDKAAEGQIMNANTATYMAKAGTKTARYYGSIACIAPEYVQQVLAKPGKGEELVLSHECIQRASEPSVLYHDKGKDVTQIMFPRTGTQLFVPTSSIK